MSLVRYSLIITEIWLFVNLVVNSVVTTETRYDLCLVFLLHILHHGRDFLEYTPPHYVYWILLLRLLESNYGTR